MCTENYGNNSWFSSSSEDSCYSNREDGGSTRSEELLTVSGQMTGSAFALAAVSTSASGIDNFSDKIKVLVDTSNLLTIRLCVSESFYLSLGGKVGDLLSPTFYSQRGV